MEEDKIISYILGQLEPDENNEVLNWISESDENREKYYRLKNSWALTSLFNETSPADKKDVDAYLKILRAKKLQIFSRVSLKIMRYAAIVLVAFFSGKYYFQNKPAEEIKKLSYNEISVPPGQMAQLTLSDGTVAYINSSSTLKYPATFNASERKVFLSGEAYFSVSKNKGVFIVESENNTVKVLGTKFNVMAYKSDNLFQTTLAEGKVALFDKQGTPVAELKPNENFSFDVATGKQTITTVKTELYDSWKDGIYIFDRETLGGISQRLERIFAVKIHIQNERIKKFKFSGTISRNVPFEQILKIIQISAPIKYKLIEKHGAINEVTLY